MRLSFHLVTEGVAHRAVCAKELSWKRWVFRLLPWSPRRWKASAGR